MFPAEVKRGERGDNEVGQKKNPEHMTAIFDMYMLVIGDDEHGVMPAVIGGVGILACIAKVSLITKSLSNNVQWQEQLENPPTFEVLDMDTIPALHHIFPSHCIDVVNLRKFLFDLRAHGDPAITHNFIPKLKDHLLSRLYQYEYDGDECQFTAVDHNHLHFVNNLNNITKLKTFHVNYTSYDVRRQQDFMQPGHGCTIMVLSREDGPGIHPFWYAQQIMEVLWVRWLGTEPGYRWGFKEACLPKVGFVPATNDDAFGFLEPSLVVRGCRLIPAFSQGRTDTLLRHGESIARQPGETDDWCAFYVNIFADRDMFSRFAGIGVGHEAQYSVQTITDSNTSEDDTLSMADTDDEGDVMFHASQDSFFQESSPHGTNGCNKGEDNNGEDEGGESNLELFDDNDNSGLDDSEGDDESGFVF
ncbi:hypothetical protein BKA83DRAFT_4504106 [Pisolithus microcarpus]|nr:hypothetical protein BKA83DRAFT_4504106 [Pisolithus microcarpus]